MVLENSTCKLQVPALRSEGLLPLSHYTIVLDAGGRLKRDEGMDTTAFDRSVKTDNALRSGTYFLIDRLHSFV